MTPLRVGSLCTGYGGLELGLGMVAPVDVRWHADNDAAVAAVLEAHHPTTPNLGDIAAVDWSTVEPVDVITAGFPCQDISKAGLRAGIREGTRSGAWAGVASAVRVLRPRFVVLENVPTIALRRPGLDRVLADLAALGFDAEWATSRASDVGAPHPRERWWCVATDAASPRREGGTRPRADRALLQRLGRMGAISRSDREEWGEHAEAVRRWEAIIGRPAPAIAMDYGRGRRLNPHFSEWAMGLAPGYVTDHLARTTALRVIGNGVVPLQAAMAVAALFERIEAPDPELVPA